MNNSTGTDTGRTYGTPLAPRATVPNPMPAGSYIEVEGAYTSTSGGFTPLRGSGNGSAWSAGSSGPCWITSSPTTGAEFRAQTIHYGSYVYVDAVTYANGGRCQIGSTSAGLGADHIMIRNCTITGPGTGANTGVPASGNSSSPIAYSLIFNNTISAWGDVNDPADNDACGIIVGRNHTYSWSLNNTITSCSGSGIRAGGSAEADDPELSKWHFIGSNHVYNVRQSGIAVKYGANVVASQNHVHDIITTDWSPSKGLMAQYAPKGWWMLYNRVENCEYGIRVASTSASLWGATWHIYAIGNVVSNCHYFSTPYNVRASGEGAIHMDGGTHHYVVGNTVANSDAGILFSCTGTIFAENNIVGPLTQSASHHLWVQNTAGVTLGVNNNLFSPGSEGLRIAVGSGPTLYTSISAFQAAQSWATGSLNSDAGFSSGSTWYRTAPTSPARNAGVADTSLESNVYATYQAEFGKDIRVDVDGTARPAESTWDIGAFEYGTNVNASARSRRVKLPVGSPGL